MRGHRVALLAGAGLMLCACAGPVVLGINLGTASTIGSLASTAVTGRGLGEHAVSALAEKDCRLIEPIFRDDRQFCEPYDSPARKEDFNGLAELFEAERAAPATMVASVAPPAGNDIAVERPEAEITAARPVDAVAVEPLPRPATAPPRKAMSAPPVPRAKPAPERALASGPFAVQVGTFAQAGNAEALARKLRAEGYQARVSRVRGDGRRTWSVIHIIGFRDAAAAERAAAAVAREHDTEPGLILTRA